jgi:hypothetical protein
LGQPNNWSKGSRRGSRCGKREDDPDGKWNYEVVVRTSGKEWGFEVDPNGKFLKKHTEIRK